MRLFCLPLLSLRMPLPFTNPHTQADLDQLASLITPVMAEHFPMRKDEIRVLNLACGRADETGILARSLASHCQRLDLIGIDIRQREIGEAKRRWSRLSREWPGAQARFFTQDASQLGRVGLLDGPFDLLFMRHQNYWNGAEVWHRIYDAALQRLHDDGILVMTSYFDCEHWQAVRVLSAMGANLTASIRNPNSRLIGAAPPKSVDRHIAVFGRSAAGLV